MNLKKKKGNAEMLMTFCVAAAVTVAVIGALTSMPTASAADECGTQLGNKDLIIMEQLKVI